MNSTTYCKIENSELLGKSDFPHQVTDKKENVDILL